MTLLELQTQLSIIENKITEIIESGTEYSIIGSHSVKNPTLKDLQKQRALIVRRILRYQGYSSRVTYTFN